MNIFQKKKTNNFIKKLFLNYEFSSICEKIVGKNFRIFTLSIRQLDNLSTPLQIHQDEFAMLTFTIPLNDISTKDASTSFIPGSHLFNFSILDDFFNIPTFLYNFLTTTYKGKVGDLGLFFNKTFHGTFVQKKN